MRRPSPCSESHDPRFDALVLFNAELELLADGFRYASSLRGRRLRVASVLPALLAEETMEKLGSASWADLSGRVKISRLTVFRCFAEALLF